MECDQGRQPGVRWPLALALAGVAAVAIGPVSCNSAKKSAKVAAETPSTPPMLGAVEAPDAVEPITTVSPHPSAPGADNLTAQQRRQLALFSQVLLSSSADVDADARRNAATELLAMNSPQASAVLDTALRSQRPNVVLPVVNALRASQRTHPALMEPLMEVLATGSAETLDPLSGVLAQHGDAALQLVHARALDRASHTHSRLSAIYALGSFRSRAAAAALMELMESSASSTEHDAPVIQAAACSSLGRLTGLSYDCNLQIWQAWWTQAQSQQPEEWQQFIAESLSRRVAELQAQIQQHKRANEQMARDLFETYRELFPALPVEEQLRRLPRLLSDSLTPVREFGVNRAALLIRDSVRLPPDTQARLAERLSDESPALRIAAARLLHDVNYESLDAVLCQRLTLETQPQVAAAWLETLARRPSAGVVPPAQAWLASPEAGDRAADALWKAYDAGAFAAEHYESTRAAARAALRARTSPSLARLLAAVGDDGDVTMLTQSLDGDDAAIRAAIAEGFCRRGLRQLLVDRADDEVVYPFALRALSEGPRTLAAMRQLADLRPTDALKPQWVVAVLKLAESLQPIEVLTADDMLAAVVYGDLNLRREVLLRVALLPREQMPGDQRVRVVARLAPILLELNESARAHEILETINGEPTAAPLRRLRFKAAALCGQFERAAQHESDARQWLDLLSEVCRRDLAAGKPLHDEVARRFADKFSPEDRARLDSISERLLKEAPAASPISLGAASD